MNRGRVIGAVIVAAIAGAVSLWAGVQAEFAIAIGILALACGVVIATPFGDDPRGGAPVAESPSRYRGSEVSRLAWAVKLRERSVGEMVTRRVRAILRRRLALHGLDPDRASDAPAIEALLGPELWKRLNSNRVRPEDIDEALRRADELMGGRVRITAPGTKKERT